MEHGSSEPHDSFSLLTCSLGHVPSDTTPIEMDAPHTPFSARFTASIACSTPGHTGCARRRVKGSPNLRRSPGTRVMLAGRKGAARHHGRESLSFLARRSPLILIGWRFHPSSSRTCSSSFRYGLCRCRRFLRVLGLCGGFVLRYDCPLTLSSNSATMSSQPARCSMGSHVLSLSAYHSH